MKALIRAAIESTPWRKVSSSKGGVLSEQQLEAHRGEKFKRGEGRVLSREQLPTNWVEEDKVGASQLHIFHSKLSPSSILSTDIEPHQSSLLSFKIGLSSLFDRTRIKFKDVYTKRPNVRFQKCFFATKTKLQV